MSTLSQSPTGCAIPPGGRRAITVCSSDRQPAPSSIRDGTQRHTGPDDRGLPKDAPAVLVKSGGGRNPRSIPPSREQEQLEAERKFAHQRNLKRVLTVTTKAILRTAKKDIVYGERVIVSPGRKRAAGPRIHPALPIYKEPGTP